MGGVDADPSGDGAPSADSASCTNYSTWGALTGRYRVGPPEPEWSLAEAACEADGGHLIVIDSDAENGEARARTTGEFWIGMSDRITEGTYLTVLGTSPAFAGWPAAPPSNTGEDCVSVLVNADWEDRMCSNAAAQAKAYVCECDGLAVTPTAFRVAGTPAAGTSAPRRTVTCEIVLASRRAIRSVARVPAGSMTMSPIQPHA
jgi:hypothetical protein